MAAKAYEVHIWMEQLHLESVAEKGTINVLDSIAQPAGFHDNHIVLIDRIAVIRIGL